MAPGEPPPATAPPAQAQVVVGLDLGTAFSGFAYAHTSDPGIFTFYDWPSQVQGGGQPYCKTPTSLYYVPYDADGAQPGAAPAVEAGDWGWPARVRYRADVQAAELRAAVEGSSAEAVLIFM